MAKQESIDKTAFLKEQRDLLWIMLCPDLDSQDMPALKAAEQLVKSYPKLVQSRMELLSLTITALEAGTTFLKRFGDIYEDYDDTMGVFWDMLEKLMEPEDLPYFKDQLIEIQEASQAIDGYGYCDHVNDMIEMIGITGDNEED